MESIRDRATAALTESLRGRDRDAAAVYRQLLSAFSNAEAVPSDARAGAIEVAGAVGSSAVEASRRDLAEDDLVTVARAELRELQLAAAEAGSLGVDAEADRLRRQAGLVADLLSE